MNALDPCELKCREESCACGVMLPAAKMCSLLPNASPIFPESSARLWNAAGDLLSPPHQAGPTEKSNADLFHLIEAKFAQSDDVKHASQLLAYFLLAYHGR